VVEDGDVERVVEYVHEQLPADWAQCPGGWPGEAEAALLYAVLSIQAVHGGPQTGVRSAVGRWRQHRGGVPLDDLGALASIGPEDLAQVLNNRQRLSGGRLKAEAIADAADRLVKAGMRSSADLDGGRGKYRRAYVTVRGLGTVTCHPTRCRRTRASRLRPGRALASRSPPTAAQSPGPVLETVRSTWSSSRAVSGIRAQSPARLRSMAPSPVTVSTARAGGRCGAGPRCPAPAGDPRPGRGHHLQRGTHSGVLRPTPRRPQPQPPPAPPG